MDSFTNIDIKYFFLKDEETVSKVYYGTYRLLFHVANSVLNDIEASKDVVSDTFIKVLDKPDTKLKNSKAFVSYLCAICKNIALDYLRKNNHQLNLDVNEEILSSNDEYSLLINDLRKLLSDDEFNVFIYKEYYGLSYKEISPLLNKPNGRCRQIYSNAKKIIKENKERFI